MKTQKERTMGTKRRTKRNATQIDKKKKIETDMDMFV